MFTFFAKHRHAATRRDAANRRKSARRVQPTAEVMEGRQLLSTFPVTNTNDQGTGSFRQALLEVLSDTNDSTATPDVISFQLSGNSLSQYRIALQSALPTLSRPVVINATGLSANVPGATGPVLELDGNNAGSTAVGLQIYGDNVTVEGLSVVGFGGGGIMVNGSVTNGVGGGANVTLQHDFVGLNNAGTVVGNGSFGVELISGANHDLLQNDTIGGSQGDGVLISGSGTSYNTLTNDFIGADNLGHQFGNAGIGVQVLADDNTLSADVVGSNGSTGVEFYQAASNTVTSTLIERNGGYGVELENASYITVGSTSVVDNNNTGVWIDSGAGPSIYDTIGQTSAGGGDIISGNNGDGLVLSGVNTFDNVVQSDLIGTDNSGNYANGNDYNGIDILSGAWNNLIGGTTASARNVVAGNVYNGVLVYSGSNTVEGNYIGVNDNGTKALPNGADGVILGAGASNNVIGGSNAAAANVISGNLGHGVTITDSGTTNNLIEGNDIGTNAAGSAAVPNHDGVVIVSMASMNNVENNVISGNLADGVYISGTGTTSNHVFSNDIGTDATGMHALGNGIYGVAITLGASSNVVGLNDSGSAAGNVISANGGDGVYVVSAGTEHNQVNYNLIGVNVYSFDALGNGGNGIEVTGGATYDSFDNNTVSGNALNGVIVSGSTTTQIQVVNNVIGTVQGGAFMFGNGGSGIVLDGTFGDTVDGNYVWSNDGWGILVEAGSGAPAANMIYGNNYGSVIGYNTNQNGDFASE